MKKTVSAWFVFMMFFVSLCLSGCVGSTLYAEQKPFTNSIGMEFVLVPAGSFMMGMPYPNCPKDDPFTEKNEYKECKDQFSFEELHEATISKAFYMGKYEVTQEQWHKVMGNNPSSFKTEKVGEYSPNYPVENVSWEDVQNFIRKLNLMEKTDAYRLPTGAEWEYAARAGSTGKYCFGDSEEQLGQYAWYDGNSGGKTHPVGQLKPNTWGIYDMHGNVSEWCRDFYVANPGIHSSVLDRVVRGGAWISSADYCWSAIRRMYSQIDHNSNVGFRLALPQVSK